jgi:hypothetical protein
LARSDQIPKGIVVDVRSGGRGYASPPDRSRVHLAGCKPVTICSSWRWPLHATGCGAHSKIDGRHRHAATCSGRPGGRVEPVASPARSLGACAHEGSPVMGSTSTGFASPPPDSRARSRRDSKPPRRSSASEWRAWAERRRRPTWAHPSHPGIGRRSVSDMLTSHSGATICE